MRPMPENPGPGFAPAWWPHVRDCLARRRRMVWLNWLAVTVLVAGVSLVLPKWYTAKAVLLPPSGEADVVSGFGSLLRGGDLAAGRLPRTTTTEDLFNAILASRTLSRLAVRRFDLVKVYHVRRESDAQEVFSKHTVTGTTKEGMVFVSVEDRDPQRAADMTNFLMDQLDHFNREVRMTSGKSSRLFVETRILETQAALRRAEDSLKSYQERHSIPVTSEAEATGAEAIAQQFALKVKLETLLLTQSEASDQVRRVRAQLNALEDELRRVPQSGTELGRRLREVKIQDQVYQLLTIQVEESKVREHKDTPTVQMLDHADKPDRKSRPRRALIVLTGAVLGLGESVLLALYLDRRRTNTGPRIRPL